jgi:DNA-binding XRE family transcriptional regulator
MRAADCADCLPYGVCETCGRSADAPPDVLRRFQVSLRRHRQNAGMSAADLGAVLGVKRQHVLRMETGTHVPLLTTAHRVAAAFGEDLGTFLNEDT